MADQKPKNPMVDVLTQLMMKAKQRSDLVTPGTTGALENVRPYTFAGRVGGLGQSKQQTPAEFLKSTSDLGFDPEYGTLPEESMVMLGGAAALGTKLFKPGASSIRELVDRLVKNEETYPLRTRLRPTIKVPKTGEIFASGVGEQHPTDVVVNTLNKRGVPAGGLQYGYQEAYEGAPFVEETLADYLRKPNGAKIVQGLLKKGIHEEQIVHLLRDETTRKAMVAGAVGGTVALKQILKKMEPLKERYAHQATEAVASKFENKKEE